MTAVDLCAGAGGWDLAARRHGIDPIGIEVDAAACATRAAAGLRTIRADMTTLDPARFHGVAGLIASPPCPTFSAAGKGAGRLILDELCAAIDDALAGLPIDRHIAAMAEAIAADDPDQDADTAAREAALTAEPARWIAAMRPEWVCMEQVPAVLPLWQHYARRLEVEGWSVWCGLRSAEQFGVPQTRKRALFAASRVRRVEPPVVTHQRYEPGVAQGAGVECGESLFGAGLLPWVSMADALGWAGGRVGFPRRDDTGTSSDGYRERDWRQADEPALALTEKARSWMVDVGQNSRMGDGTTKRYTRPVDRPAPGLTTRSGGQWTFRRPATTIACDPRVAPPGHHDENTRQMDGAVKLTVEEAACLQAFPPDHPWQGTRTARFRQIGNAIPPPMAGAVLATVLPTTTGATPWN